MNESIEIEYKTMLTQQEYHQLINYYQLNSSQFVTQTNLYFDTLDYQLKEKNMGLRIRFLDSRAEVTLKIPQKVGLLEVTDKITQSDVDKAIKTEQFPKDTQRVSHVLLSEAIKPDDLRLIGSLVTKRAELDISEGKLAIDENWYQNQHDYELELEVQDSGRQKSDFFALLNYFSIPYRPAMNKIVRAVTLRK
ncbi:CYTH domain-containing protein [Enterococcus sp. AZ109]|uniref:CYTH domain-containing protein n=1 Tax=Enterococcus sp. AZ109 TaxID=2774634 RepID=UPI003F683D39